MKQLQSRYEATSFHEPEEKEGDYSAPLGRLKVLPQGYGLWMPGMALLAGHLAAKKNVQNLFVAKTMEAFTTALKVKLLSEESFRMVIILSPTFSWGELPKNFPQHKVAVGIEKDSSLNMVNFDSLPIGGQVNVDSQHFSIKDYEDIWNGHEPGGPRNFNSPELVCRAFFKASEGFNIKKRVFHSHVVRQQKWGCAVFALKDGLSFLQNPDFFQSIKCEKEKIEIPVHNAKLRHISALPSIYMRGTQIMDQLAAYQNQEPELFKAKFPSKNKTLQDSLDKSVIDVMVGEEQKRQNHYITKREIKYLTWLVHSLETAPEQSKSIMDRVLLQ
jgi:hypothetical protein